MKKIFSLLIILILIISSYCFIVKPIYDTINFPENMYVTNADIDYANNNSNFSPIFKFSLPKETTVSNEEVTATTMDIKLFGWLPIKKVKVKVINDVDVYAGGNTVGFYLNTEGVIVVGSNPIFTINGSVEPIKNTEILEGDIIKEINDIEIKTIEDIEKILNNPQNEISETVSLEIERNNQILNIDINPALDLYTQKYRLGLWVKNNASGVGTLTYVKKNNNRFGAVGHPISSNDLSKDFKISDGQVYLCNYLGITKGTKEHPGEIKTSIKLSDNTIGVADTNCEYGVYGNMHNLNLLDLSKSVELGGRMSVKLGDAEIFCDLDGQGVKGYKIKIVKTSHQNKANEKSIMFRVTDPELIEKTGGIIQGMSGSPIIQNGKLIGAVTHVFLNDPTKAFGVYIDWMIDN